MLDFRTETFLCVCNHMNYTKAAQECHITQPAVTQQIHYLEEYYQTKLFSYQNKKLSLTDSGKQLRDALLATRSNLEALKDQLSTFPNKKTKIHFGATFTIGQFLVPAILSDFLKQHPDFTTELTVQNTHALLPMLSRGEIDFALIEGYFSKQDFSHRLLTKEQLVCVCSKDYTFLSGFVPTYVDELVSEHLLVRESGSGSRELLEHALLEKNIALDDFHNITCANNPFVLLELAKKGLGITFSFSSAVKPYLKDGSLVELALKDFSVSHPFSFVYRTNSLYEDAYLKCFEEFKQILTKDSSIILQNKLTVL